MLPTTKKTNRKKKKEKGFRFMGVDFGKDRTKGKLEAKGGGRLTDKDNSAIVLDSKTKTKRKVKTAKAGGRLTDKDNSAIVTDDKAKPKRKVRTAKNGGKVLTTKQKQLDVNNDGKIDKKDFDTINAKPKSKPPVTDSTNPKTGATRGSGAPMVPVKKMGGGKVMKYKKGGMVYMKNGGAVGSKEGAKLVAACYD